MNSLRQILECGQSIWLDFIDRHLVATGELARMIEVDGIRGVTSNPAIFEKAVAEDPDYRAGLRALHDAGIAPSARLEKLVLPDIQAAADCLLATYETSGGRDGFVSLEVSPALARNAEDTVREARRLRQAVGRRNLMIKVPATDEALPAITQLISEGVAVNVTLLFSRSMHLRVMDAYCAGLERRAAQGHRLDEVASVASFFVSRIDTEVDARLDALLASTKDDALRRRIRGLQGKAAIANAKLAYRNWQEQVAAPRWQALQDKGAHPQRLLWASTGVKNPAYRDVRYVEDLIGPQTVNTVPPATLNAFREHGVARVVLDAGVDAAAAALAEIEALGIAMDDVTAKLLDAGLAAFVHSYDALLQRLASV